MPEVKNSTAKNVLLLIAITIVTLVLVWLIVGKKYQSNGSVSLYYREDCPHCKIVEQYIADNNIEAKIQIEKKEVKENMKNNNELMLRATNCGLDLQTVGVPLLYDAGSCYMGDTEIINYLISRL